MTAVRGEKLVYTVAHHCISSHSAGWLIKGNLLLEIMAVVGTHIASRIWMPQNFYHRSSVQMLADV